jgi:hypothetical protein
MAMKLSDRDLDALRRALIWGRGYQQRNPQLKLFPDPMPAEGSQAWLELAEYMAGRAQAHHLGLKPWQCGPLDIEATGFANNADERALWQTLHDLGISIYEPDPAAALDNATQRR